MIDGTNLNQLTGSRQLLRAFGGINETYSCSEAELSAALNFSGRGFPALQTRALRKKVRDVEKVNGMYHLNGLLICRGTGLEYAPDGQTGRTAAVTLENVLTDDRKALAGMGSKVLIWPDRLAFDTETGQLEPLGAKWELGDRKMTVCPCDTEGKVYEVAGAGDTEPESPEDGQLFLKGDPKNLYDYESVLEKWSAKSGKWVQVLVNTVRMTCPGIGSLLKEGDTVTLTGMPQAVSYDGGPWETLRTAAATGDHARLNLPFEPRRHDTMRLKLSGTGQIALRSMAFTLAGTTGGRVTGAGPRK